MKKMKKLWVLEKGKVRALTIQWSYSSFFMFNGNKEDQDEEEQGEVMQAYLAKEDTHMSGKGIHPHTLTLVIQKTDEEIDD